MPKIIFEHSEVADTVKSKVNKSGYAYVGRKYAGKEVIWILLKK